MPTIAARPSGRVRRPAQPRARRRATVDTAPRRRTTDLPQGQESLAYRIKGWTERAGRSGLLDAIVYRRLWIPFLAAALIGIVAMQVVTLGVNAGIGRTVDRSALLERENTVLAAEVSRLESADHLSAAVSGLGLVDPEPGSTRYLRADGTVLADSNAPVTTAVPGAPAVAQAPAPASVVQDQTAAAPQQPATSVPVPAATQEPAPATSTPPAETQTPVAQTPAASAAPAAVPVAAAPSGGSAAPIAPVSAVGIR